MFSNPIRELSELIAVNDKKASNWRNAEKKFKNNPTYYN